MTTTSATSSTNSYLESYLTAQASAVAADSTTVASGSSSLAYATSASTIGSNFNTFIQILTTQLQNQDPTNTTDPNQFTEELVQFAGVEQQLNTNNDLQTLINLTKSSSGTTAALNYVGHYVEASASSSDSLSLQSGEAEIGYDLASSASAVTLTISNSAGSTVATLTGSTNVGMNYISWNGTDSSGNSVADGSYTYTLQAYDSSGDSETVSSITKLGKVTGVVSNSDGTTSLQLGSGVTVLTSAVDAVYDAASSIPSATSTLGSS